MISFINAKSAAIFSKIPESVTLFIARFAIAAVFWRSGQTKIQGFSLDIITMKAEFGYTNWCSRLYSILGHIDYCGV